MKQYAIFENNAQDLIGYIITDAPRDIFENMVRTFCNATRLTLSLSAIVDALRSCGHKAMTEADICTCMTR